MSKSPQAFRTIREVAEWLDVAAHVLRFWESKFPQIKPVKRAGGRRYYRPADMALVGGIKVLLHEQGLTIRGVKKMIREEGVAHIASLSPPFEAAGVETLSGTLVTEEDLQEDAAAGPAGETEAEDAAPEAKQVTDTTPAPAELPLEETEAEPGPEPEPEPVAAQSPETARAPEPAAEADSPHAAPAGQVDHVAHLRDLVARGADLPADRRQALGPALARLQALRDRMAGAPPA
ncbi:MerR family transcriptional regulator [Rhodophyticola porphyridii]|uniref:MerR family transcriptional regulator n=1 Tax=Rhodophyticola porphyridii TaxID=1852017 RepID=A0A3L9Y400_9RHOB|nr:MerR family transcriptional regulator [Rhodophyticola porphyridii]RMA42048.1 MerR family transcriptional regulator [Rhodophyticola porphyridii]